MAEICVLFTTGCGDITNVMAAKIAEDSFMLDGNPLQMASSRSLDAPKVESECFSTMRFCALSYDTKDCFCQALYCATFFR